MNLLRRRGKRAEQRFARLVDEGDVPVFPNVVAEAIREVSAPDVDLGKVATTVSADPKLTVSILKLANSPAYAPRSPITSVHQAAVMLGRNQLESLLISTGVADTMPREDSAGHSPRRFWLVAAYRAPAAAAMAARIDPAAQYDQFTAALLQDMAQPILLHHDPDYVALLQAYGQSHGELARHEQEALGWTHGEIGEMLCTQWGLPEELAVSVGLHHSPPVEGYEIAQWVSLIEGPASDVGLLVAEGQQRLGVSEETVISVLREAHQRASEIASVFA